MEYKYVKTKGKPRIDDKLYSWEQITAPNYTGDFGRIIPKGWIVFDYDKQPYIDIISNIIETSKLKCKKLTTNKGVHYMFKTSIETVPDATKTYNFIGLQCDIKACGTKDRKESYQAIKVNGEMRKEEFINCSSDEEVDFAPKWLYSIKKKKDRIDLTIDQEGERNNLFHRRIND